MKQWNSETDIIQTTYSYVNWSIFNIGVLVIYKKFLKPRFSFSYFKLILIVNKCILEYKKTGYNEKINHILTTIICQQ